MSLRRWIGTGVLLLAGVWPVAPALAGPPYVTDDPEPTDPGTWEIYGFASGSVFSDRDEGEGGFDINYGAAPDLQASAVIAMDYSDSPGEGAHAGFGDMEIGLKYRFVHQDRHGWIPDIAVFPKLTLPTAGSRFGTGKVGAHFPVWAEKDFGNWSLFGGGGFLLNPGKDNRNYGQLGLAVTRSLGRLGLGAELYHTTPDRIDGRPSTNLGLGATYLFAPHWSLIGSGGPVLAHSGANGNFAFYAALEFHD
jgi:Putative MetA-pathway of phenol degradation